jgi:hypothetical protein
MIPGHRSCAGARQDLGEQAPYRRRQLLAQFRFAQTSSFSHPARDSHRLVHASHVSLRLTKRRLAVYECMAELEQVFHQIIDRLPNASEGKFFGAKSIKANNGKTAAFFWRSAMGFRLGEQGQQQALCLKGSRVASHLYAPGKPMKGWVRIPAEHHETWLVFAKKAIRYVNALKK